MIDKKKGVCSFMISGVIVDGTFRAFPTPPLVSKIEVNIKQPEIQFTYSFMMVLIPR